MRLLGIFLTLLIVGGVITCAVVYQQEVMDFSTQYQAQKKASQALERNSPQEAIAILEDTLKHYPNNVELTKFLAHLQLTSGAWDKARILYKRATTLAPEDTQAMLGYASALGKEYRYNDALLIFRKLLDERPHDPDILNQIGAIYLDAAVNPGEHRKKLQKTLNQWAIYYYQMSLFLNPQQTEPHFNLGVLHQRLGHDEKSAVHYCQAIIGDNSRFEFRYNLGLSLISLGEYEEGFRQMDESVRLLGEQNRLEDAQNLAETIQSVKNTIRLGEGRKHLGLQQHRPRVPKGFDTQCILQPGFETEGEKAGSTSEDEATHTTP